MTTGQHRVHHDPIPGLEMADPRPDILDDSDDLVTGNLQLRPVIGTEHEGGLCMRNCHIAAADSGQLGTEAQPARRLRQHGLWRIFD